MKLIFLCRWVSQLSVNRYYYRAWPGMSKVLKTTRMPCLQFLKKELSYEVDVLHADKHESLLQVDLIIFDGFGQAYPNFPGKFAVSLWYLKKEARNEVRGLIVLACSNTTLTIYYASNIPPWYTLFLSQCAMFCAFFTVFTI